MSNDPKKFNQAPLFPPEMNARGGSLGTTLQNVWSAHILTIITHLRSPIGFYGEAAITTAVIRWVSCEKPVSLPVYMSRALYFSTHTVSASNGAAR